MKQWAAGDDDRLIARTLAGDAAAFETLYRRYATAVYRLAYRLTGNAADAEEVMQDSFLKAHAALHQYRGAAPLWSWLKSLTVRRALRHLRRARYRHWLGLDAIAEPAISDTTAPLAAAADLEQALARLDATDRAVLWLHHGEGYRHAEIAALWGKSLSFSKSRLARAERRLREHLQATESAHPQATWHEELV